MTTFADPAPPAPAFSDPTPPPAFRRNPNKYIVNGRYRLPDPDTGQMRDWTRVTNMEVLEDKFGIHRWEMRMVAKGMSLDSSLVAQSSILDVDRDWKELNDIAWRAKGMAGGSTGANLGKALHTLTEHDDQGLQVTPGAFAGELQVYRATLAAEGLVVDPAYLERIVCVPELGCIGTLDKLLRLPDTLGAEWSHQVGDLKSQKSMEHGGIGIGSQLAIYSRAYALWNEETECWEDPPAIDQERATVIWLPVGKGVCELYDVNLNHGWAAAKASYSVREDYRKRVYITKREPTAVKVPAPPFDQPAADTSSRPNLEDPQPMSEVEPMAMWESRFRRATTVDGLAAMGRQAAGEFGGTLPDALKALGAELRATLTEAPAPASPTMYADEGAWELVFRAAKSLEELTRDGRNATADFGGTLPEALKALGAELRAKLTAP